MHYSFERDVIQHNQVIKFSQSVNYRHSQLQVGMCWNTWLAANFIMISAYY